MSDDQIAVSNAAEEQAVRDYLMWITDPSKLIDPEVVATLERAAAAATDPLERLRALSRLELARSVDGERYKLSFIKYAKSWADANQITPTAFRELGVDDTILRAAGIGLSSSRARARPAAGASGSPRAPRASGGSNISSEQIKHEVLTWSEQFVLSDVVGRVGGSPMTVRKAIDDLVESGAVRRLGPAHDHHGRGRAPIVYRVA